MNVLMVLSQVEVTGAEVYATSISNKLTEKGHHVILVSDTLTIPTRARYIAMPLNKRRFDLQIKFLIDLVRIVRREKIQVIHTHSRISCKLSYIVSKICGIPMIYTAHGRHHVHLSKKLYPAYGDYTLAICENVKEQIIRDLKWNSKKMEILRNGVDHSVYNPLSCHSYSGSPTIAIIGRLSGPKGDTCFHVLEEICYKNPLDPEIKIKVIGGSKVPERFDRFKNWATFSGYKGNVKEEMCNASLVIGSGRVAIESLMLGKPTIAFGEASYEGLVTTSNYENVLKSNFGDISETGSLETSRIVHDITEGLKMGKCPDEIRNRLYVDFDLGKVTDRIEFLYQRFYSRKRYEVPILLYHRVIANPGDAGKHGTYVTLEQLEEHFKYLKENNYTTITFNDLSMVQRFNADKKYIILTFDDGYEDNYSLLLPLLKKYNFTAVIYLTTHLKENTWDLQEEGKTFPLLKKEQVVEMSRFGVEFGAHTMHHVDLTGISEQDAGREIEGSKEYIESLLNKKVNTFAYPYGKVNAPVKNLVKESGFKYGIATVSGPGAIHEDLFNIRRIVIHPNTNIQRFMRKVKGNYIYRKKLA